ncbi:MAG: 2-oxoglutarate oxidoreductase subunit KorB [Bacteroidota bacterium]|jgi:2-oxoglutarate ferredoxin oxidoreductase subunit beta
MIPQGVTLQPKEYKSNQEVRWCPGCGDIAVLNSVHKAMAELGLATEEVAVISGIGCSSRFPYYMNTYGFHTIHGRAGAIASGVKVANPKLSVWQVTGDGDAMAIGGNHFIHEIRRNIDLNIVLLNNQIYGLTKGQYSPTSAEGKVTKTSPYGTIEPPFIPGELTIGAQGKFFARTIDGNLKLSVEVFKAAHEHRGTSVVEVLQNCVIFNDKVFADFTDKLYREERQLVLEAGQPMIYGEKRDKGLVLDGLKLKTVTIGEGGYTLADILVHDPTEADPTLHMMLARASYPDFPVVLGVIRSVEATTYEEKMENQIQEISAKSNISCMTDLLFSGSTWVVE